MKGSVQRDQSHNSSAAIGPGAPIGVEHGEIAHGLAGASRAVPVQDCMNHVSAQRKASQASRWERLDQRLAWELCGATEGSRRA